MKSLILLIALLGAAFAHAECYERYYSKKHFEKNPGHEIKDIQLDWWSEWKEEAEESTHPFRLYVQILRDGKLRTGLIEGTCSTWPWAEKIYNEKAKFAKDVKCNLNDNVSVLELVSYKGDKDFLGILTKGATFKEITYGAADDATFQLADGDHRFGLDTTREIGFWRCEEPLLKASSYTIPRLWNESILFSIRNDLARPTVTARNLYHFSALMWDVYALFESDRPQFQLNEYAKQEVDQKEKARNVAMSYAAYHFLLARYKEAPGNTQDMVPDEFGDGVPDERINVMYKRLMQKLDLNPNLKKARAESRWADLGISMSEDMLKKHINDGSREKDNYAGKIDELKNPNKGLYLAYLQSGIKVPYEWVQNGDDGAWVGGKDIADQYNIDYWIPLHVPGALDQGGNEQESKQGPLTLFWGSVPTFSDLSAHKSKDKAGVYFDPGKHLPTWDENPEELIRQNLEVVKFSALLNPIDLVKEKKDFDGDGEFDQNPGSEMMDISPAGWGNHTLGTNDGKGREVNPITGKPYKPFMVKKADFYRSIAEFWADGPDSETPPGHWNTLANYTIDRIKEGDGDFKWKGQESLSREEYELRTYLALNGALHDAAVVAWGIKGHYEANRPISVLRKLAHMAENDGDFAKKLIAMAPDYLKMVTYVAHVPVRPPEYPEEEVSTTPETRTKLIVKAWRGHPDLNQYIDGGAKDRRDFTWRKRDDLAKSENKYYGWDIGANGVGWILAENWMPYQQTNFVTPPFPGFVSGHSTFSRAAAEVLAYTTGSKFFPGGLGKYKAPHLEFEQKFESEGFYFQWATFFDASDQSGISRLYGGIHASYDDLPAREIGSKVGKAATQTVDKFFSKKQ